MINRKVEKEVIIYKFVIDNFLISLISSEISIDEDETSTSIYILLKLQSGRTKPLQ